MLLCISRDRTVRIRDIAQSVGITERAVTLIIDDLETGGYLTRYRVGRRNEYTVHARGKLRHPLEAKHSVGELLRALDA